MSYCSGTTKAELIGLAQIITLMAQQLKDGRRITPVMLDCISKDVERIAKDLPSEIL